jgi:hypothetical protein
MTRRNVLAVSDDYVLSDLAFAKDGTKKINGLFFNSVVFDDEEVVEAIGELQGRSYQQVAFFNCSGQLLAEALSIVMTKMEVDSLVLEYSSAIGPDGDPLFQDKHSKALGEALVGGSPIKSLRLNGLCASETLGKALQAGLPKSNIQTFEWVQNDSNVLAMLQTAEDRSITEYEFWMSLLAGVQACNTIQHLEFRHVRRDEIMSHVMTTLRSHPSLKHLGISVRGFGSNIQHGIETLVSAPTNVYETANVTEQATLQSLKISVCGKLSHFPNFPRPQNDQTRIILEFINTTDQQISVISEGVSRNTEIKEIRLLHHHLSCKGVRILSSWLSKSQTRLRKIYVQGSSIGDLGAFSLLAAVRENPSWLEVVELPRGTRYRCAIQHFADLNKAGWSEMIRIESNRVKDIVLWPLVIERANKLEYCSRSPKENAARRVNSLFHLLRGPATLHVARLGETKQTVDMNVQEENWEPNRQDDRGHLIEDVVPMDTTV